MYTEPKRPRRPKQKAGSKQIQHNTYQNCILCMVNIKKLCCVQVAGSMWITALGFSKAVRCTILPGLGRTRPLVACGPLGSCTGADLHDTNLGDRPRSDPRWPMAHAPFYFLLLTIRWRLETVGPT